MIRPVVAAFQSSHAGDTALMASHWADLVEEAERLGWDPVSDVVHEAAPATVRRRDAPG